MFRLKMKTRSLYRMAILRTRILERFKTGFPIGVTQSARSTLEPHGTRGRRRDPTPGAPWRGVAWRGVA